MVGILDSLGGVEVDTEGRDRKNGVVEDIKIQGIEVKGTEKVLQGTQI